MRISAARAALHLRQLRHGLNSLCRKCSFAPSGLAYFPLLSQGLRVCVRTPLSPRWGLIVSHFHPGLAPWSAFWRRFAAKIRGCCSTENWVSLFSRTHLRPGLHPGAASRLSSGAAVHTLNRTRVVTQTLEAVPFPQPERSRNRLDAVSLRNQAATMHDLSRVLQRPEGSRSFSAAC
jgi:hypothetical protein